MFPLVRVVLLVLLAVVFVGAVIGLFSVTTGPSEKVALALLAVLVTVAAPRVQRLGSRAAH